MDRIEFERDLDAYISQRRKPSSSRFWKNLFARKLQIAEEKKAEPRPQTVKLQEPVDVPVSDDDKSVGGEYDTDKKSAFSRIFEWLIAGSPQTHDAVSPVEVQSALLEKELVEDMREIAKISIATFRKLPVHKIREFKMSDDFEKFRNILKKHGLSKE